MQRLFICLVVLATLAAPKLMIAKADDRSNVIALAEQIRKADYEGDRSALRRLYGSLEPFLHSNDTTFSSRVLYWRGFALWRRAINGFNDGTSHNELQADLQQAQKDFEAASHQDPKFADAKIGALGHASPVGWASGSPCPTSPRSSVAVGADRLVVAHAPRPSVAAHA